MINIKARNAHLQGYNQSQEEQGKNQMSTPATTETES